MEIALSPGFRWGTTLLPAQSITIDDLYANFHELSCRLPHYMTGEQLKNMLEDVCDNLFNPVPY